MKNTFVSEFKRIIKNCQLYEDKVINCENDNYLFNLISEIGALRGLSYAYQLYHNDLCPLEFEISFIYYIRLGNSIQNNIEINVVYAET